jgi:hypothetical protein
MFRILPLALRRLLYLVSVLSFAAAFINWYANQPSALLFAIALICSGAESVVQIYFGKAATTPLFPVVTLPTLPTLPALPKGGRVFLLGVVALLVFFFLPTILRHTIDPRANGFTPDTIGGAALGAFHYFAALTIAYASWRWLFPSLYEYAAETMEGKLLESITAELLMRIPTEYLLGQENILSFRLAALAERRKIATLQFSIRCVRFVFSVSPFVFFFVQANHALLAALTAVPSSASGL